MEREREKNAASVSGADSAHSAKSTDTTNIAMSPSEKDFCKRCVFEGVAFSCPF